MPVAVRIDGNRVRTLANDAVSFDWLQTHGSNCITMT
jgi:hypothetical protein